MSGPPVTAGPPRVHRLPANHRVWTPANVICFDTETCPEQTPGGELHTPRYWAARLDVRRSRRKAGLGTVTNWGRTPAQLADQLTEWCTGVTSVWAYAHNLSFDLTATRLPEAMEALGWEVTEHAVGGETPWLRMRRKGCVVTFADSWGWLRAPLAAVGADVGITKPPLPDWDDSDAAWVGRCEADVDILAEAMLALMGWWDREQLGNWGLTGAAGGWNAMRHMPLPQLPLIVGEADFDAADLRAATYGGYRYAMHHGANADGPYELWDFERAYTVLAKMPLPVKPAGSFASLSPDSPWIGGERYGVVAEVELDTDTPRYPVHAGGRVVYPVGRFRTVLAGPEIAEARRLGHLVSIGKGQCHKLSPWLSPWADWIIDALEDDTGAVPVVAKRVVKHWGRAVVGKFGAHGYAKTAAGPAQHPGWWYEQTLNAATGKMGALVEVGGRAWLVDKTPMGDNAYPAVLAFVEAWCRVLLNRAIDAAGRDRVISADTDGFLVPGRPSVALLLAHTDLGPLTMRRKGTYSEVTVWGPQHMTGPGLRKMSGIPASAVPGQDGRLYAMLWPKLAWQMGHAPPEGYLRPVQAYRLAASYVTGWVLTDGTVAPVEAALCAAGGNHMLPWRAARGLPPGVDVAGGQAATLDDVITAPPPMEEPCMLHSSRSNGTATASNPSPPMKCSPSSPNRATPRAARRKPWPFTGRKRGTHRSRE